MIKNLRLLLVITIGISNNYCSNNWYVNVNDDTNPSGSGGNNIILEISLSLEKNHQVNLATTQGE
jgi:adenosylcobinamide amidohydrolase